MDRKKTSIMPVISNMSKGTLADVFIILRCHFHFQLLIHYQDLIQSTDTSPFHEIK